MNYSKTEVGQQAFKERSSALSARQRSAFILFDGVKSLRQVLAATTGLGMTVADVEYMVAQGFLVADPSAVAAAEAVTVAATARSARTPQERYAEACPLATQLTASLGLRGFKLNLAIEGAAGYDDLLALLPKIQAAVGHEASRPLERALLA
ncbi:MAG: hypothetical protein Q8R72_08185 [Hylemonella sp.]|nr:hypothetical protein [Hylemonella sp.]